jgi:hypothetical protein
MRSDPPVRLVISGSFTRGKNNVQSTPGNDRRRCFVGLNRRVVGPIYRPTDHHPNTAAYAAVENRQLEAANGGHTAGRTRSAIGCAPCGSSTRSGRAGTTLRCQYEVLKRQRLSAELHSPEVARDGLGEASLRIRFAGHSWSLSGKTFTYRTAGKSRRLIASSRKIPHGSCQLGLAHSSASAIAAVIGSPVRSSIQRYCPPGLLSRNTYLPSGVTIKSKQL